MRRLSAAILALAAGLASAADEIRFTRYKLDAGFWSEGVAIGDINKDGKMDVFAGDVWFEQVEMSPDGKSTWRRHEVRTPKPRTPDLRRNGGDPEGSPHDGSKGYSSSFACFAGDFNGDGWVDFIVVNFPGEEFYWYENPKGRPGHWKEHLLWRSGCNETPNYGDLLRDGKPGLLLAIKPEGQMAYFRPGADPFAPWPPLAITEKNSPGTDRFSHGLGMGDVNGDGRPDVLITDGWWEQPAEAAKTPWKFHPLGLRPPKHTPPDANREQSAMADVFAYDVDGDGDMDLIASSAHKYGIWWFENVGPKENPKFIPHLIREDFSESHAMRLVDMDGDGIKDIVTGKRFYSHMRGEPGSLDPAVVVWIKITREGGKPVFTSHTIDADSGIGTQFVADDFNGDGKPDVITANKKGVHVFLQQPGAAKPTVAQSLGKGVESPFPKGFSSNKNIPKP